MSIPKLPEHHLDQEIAHVEGIGKLLAEGWSLSGVQLTADVRTHEHTDVLTLFPDEQKRVTKLLAEICADRSKEIEKQRVARDKAAQPNG